MWTLSEIQVEDSWRAVRDQWDVTKDTMQESYVTEDTVEEWDVNNDTVEEWDVIKDTVG